MQPEDFTLPARRVSRVFIHCSASDADGMLYRGEDLVRTIRRWHTDPRPKGRGWSDIGYHYLIDKRGALLAGRPLERIPAAQAGHNTGTIAIMVHGLREFTPESLDTLRQLCVIINDAYGGNITFHGHCEVSNKSCPVFDYRTLLKLNNMSQMPLDPAETVPPLPRRKPGRKLLETSTGKTGTAGVLASIGPMIADMNPESVLEHVTNPALRGVIEHLPVVAGYGLSFIALVALGVLLFRKKQMEAGKT